MTSDGDVHVGWKRTPTRFEHPRADPSFPGHLLNRPDTASCAAERLSAHIPCYRHQHGVAADQ
jgi:hypothetical protein